MRLLLKKRRCAMLLAAVAVTGLTGWLYANGQEPAIGEGKDAKAVQRVEDLSWMTGEWHGTLFGGPIEERWQAPRGGSMLGTSRMGESAERTMYELMLIEVKDGVPTMFLRHFRQFLSTRENAPMAFKLTSLKDNAAVFEADDKSHSFSRIEYERVDQDTLVVRLMGERGGKPQKVESRLNRVP